MSDFSCAVQMLASPGGAAAREPDPTPEGPRQKRLLSFSDLTEEQVRALHDYIGGEENEYDGEIEPWAEEDVVRICFLLLKSLDCFLIPRSGKAPRTPIIDTIRLLNWVSPDPTRQAKPFSFDFCVQVVCLSPLSDLPFIGRVDVEELRERLVSQGREVLRQSLARYPEWVQAMIKSAPDAMLATLDRDPQFLNKEIRKREKSQTVDMFG